MRSALLVESLTFVNMRSDGMRSLVTNVNYVTFQALNIPDAYADSRFNAEVSMTDTRITFNE